MAPLLDDLKANASAPKCVVGNMHKKGTRQSITGKHSRTGKYTYRPAHTLLCVHAYNIFNFSHFLTNEKSNER